MARSTSAVGKLLPVRHPDTVRRPRHLTSHFTVFTYDRRGRGQSTDTLPYAVEREIDDLQSLIEAASGSAFVYRLSSGGC